MIPSIVEEIARLHRQTGYRIVRPVLANDVPRVRQWLQNERGGGWRHGDDADRMKVARRLLWVIWLIDHGRLGKRTEGAP